MASDRIQKCLDKRGEEFEITVCKDDDLGRVKKMYQSFEPKACAQGLPPLDRQTLNRWVRGMVKGGENFMALKQGQVVGHAVIIPDLTRQDAEFLIFVLPPYQNRGLGTALTGMALQRARHMGIKLLFLEVELRNSLAIGLYKKFGFQFCGSDCESERTMSLNLELNHEP
ncbi:MAG: GNAT family N-acetyltransferase [Desulfarculaceae bacterium]|jgi:GNAT superfamily N-acetyltransferase